MFSVSMFTVVSVSAPHYGEYTPVLLSQLYFQLNQQGSNYLGMLWRNVPSSNVEISTHMFRKYYLFHNLSS